MKKQDNKQRICWAVALTGMMLRVLPVSGAVEETETWDGPDTAGWTNRSDSVTLANAGGYLEMQYAAQALPDYDEDIAYGRLDAAVRITHITFRFLAESVPPSLVRAALFARSSGRIWQIDLPPPRVGEWTTYSLSLDETAGWFAGADGTPEAFREDLGDIEAVGVYVRRLSATDPQAYGVDDYTVIGLAVSPDDRDGDGLPDAWEQRYGFDLNDPSDAAEDADGDGMSNLSEYLAGTGPRDPASRLAVEIRSAREPVTRTVIGVQLHWVSASNRVYSVWRRHHMKGEDFVPLQTGLVATPPENTYTDTTATNATGFYRIRVRPAE